MRDLIEAIKKEISLVGWNDAEFCRQSGIDPGLWSKVQGLDAKPGVKFLSALVRVFPQLGRNILDYVREYGIEDDYKPVEEMKK
jgi:hypothetical protein